MNVVMIEISAAAFHDRRMESIEKELKKTAPSFQLDFDYPLIPMEDSKRRVYSFIVKGQVDEQQVFDLKQSNAVIDIFHDTPVMPL